MKKIWLAMLALCVSLVSQGAFAAAGYGFCYFQKNRAFQATRVFELSPQQMKEQNKIGLAFEQAYPGEIRSECRISSNRASLDEFLNSPTNVFSLDWAPPASASAPPSNTASGGGRQARDGSPQRPQRAQGTTAQPERQAAAGAGSSSSKGNGSSAKDGDRKVKTAKFEIDPNAKNYRQCLKFDEDPSSHWVTNSCGIDLNITWRDQGVCEAGCSHTATANKRTMIDFAINMFKGSVKMAICQRNVPPSSSNKKYVTWTGGGYFCSKP
ncbi:MAG: hypothetical protein LBE33_08005 [Zoogloeaceae bacterium]|nr:hypothetical protein [Zoogloeaceae bacterium]